MSETIESLLTDYDLMLSACPSIYEFLDVVDDVNHSSTLWLNVDRLRTILSALRSIQLDEIAESFVQQMTY